MGVWERFFWGNRKKHRDLDEMFKNFSGRRGVYFIGCGEKIVYIGQSIGATMGIAQRSIESLANCYHRVDDIALPWSIGLATVNDDDLNELESTAIRKYAPIFNTSIPSKEKSAGKMPVVSEVFRVFADQHYNSAAFKKDNLAQQAKEAAINPSPPWQKGQKRRK